MAISSKDAVKSVEDVITKQRTKQVKQLDNFSFKNLKRNFSESNGMSLTSGPRGPSSP